MDEPRASFCLDEDKNDKEIVGERQLQEGVGPKQDQF